MINIDTASGLLDFGVRIGQGQRAQEQLEGAVAIHNILEQHGVAYLADEVGMGKTYVALGALALFRHFNPNFRVLIIAPRENIQYKWMKELRNFVFHNVRFADIRVKGLDGYPVRPTVPCGNLLNFVHEVTLDPNRDFFLRLTSFSLPISGRDSVDPEISRRLRDGLRHALPWMRDEVFDLRNKQAFKENVAKAICCVLPQFDLVIVDEGHNLKHGLGKGVAARNQVLNLALGHSCVDVDKNLFQGYGPRVRRVLFLSATPVEESYAQLWNQLEVFGMGAPFENLCRQDLEEDEKKGLAAKFLLRRVTTIRVGDKEHTKNLYRREWRRGGVNVHDEPIRIEDPKQRLIIALVQKKVSELLGNERFGSSFQIGMLASFESFLETTKLKRENIEEISNFDDAEQTEDARQREGLDVEDINRLSRSYFKEFREEMPHPKMDALVDSLAEAWSRGEKSLVFVRRIASVKDIKKKLDERYNKWLITRLQSQLPPTLHGRINSLYEEYLQEVEKQARRSENQNRIAGNADDEDHGGLDTFFAWFFRGEGPSGVISGANIQRRFIQSGTVYSTFFEDNVVADVIGSAPGDVERALAGVLQVAPTHLRAGLRERSRKYLSAVAKKHTRSDRFEAVQAAAIEWLKDASNPFQEIARIVWQERYQFSAKAKYASEAPDIGDWLELKTFFTELRSRDGLREKLWPRPNRQNLRDAFREQALRGQLLSSAARLGHAFIDLYIMTIQRLGSLEIRAQESSDDENANVEVERIVEYLDLLEKQMQTPLGERDWSAYDELTDISAHFDLILDVNAPDAYEMRLSETARLFGQLLQRQQPVGGMSGQVNQTLVRQFRMPGYPFVLISTDLLQEGEDLHTFCSSVHHYGISWTSSSMEQRIGRIDRVRSQTDRRLAGMSGLLQGEDMLQVYFPHLEDTVEVLQVQRVLERMNVFLRLMHEGLTISSAEERTINTHKEFARPQRFVQQIRQRLESAFPVRSFHLTGDKCSLAVGPERVAATKTRFSNIKEQQIPGLNIEWEDHPDPGLLLGTAQIDKRIQPFTLLLKSFGSRSLVRCISPVGRIGPSEEMEAIVTSAIKQSCRIGAIVTKEDRTYDLTVEDDVLLANDTDSDASRIGMLIKRVTCQADRLEQNHLPGRDEVMDVFRSDLKKEISNGH